MRKHAVLGLLAERDLAAIVRQSPIRSLPRGHVLFRGGAAGHAVVLVLQGYVKLSTTAANDREVVLEIAGPGTLFGEIAVLNNVPRQADAKALTPCRLMVINGGLFRHALAATPEAMFGAIRLLSERLSKGTERGIDAVALPARLRVAKALLHLVELHAEQGGNSVQVAFRLSQSELGAMAGLIRESINKHLKPWRAAGWLDDSDGTITVRDVRPLRELLGVDQLH
ncbi:MAG TPA: Crp/Fnr family transcriptional regulator [Acetobacteraceae bacterium]|nr:Crp/Fnr family transcriptional regulator [Acetobacteraceae bacterium]